MARPDTSGAFPGHDWFSIVEIAPSAYMISEPVHVNCYLIVGSEAAVLFDTGLGIANIRLVAEALAGKPLRVVNSHYHFDHSSLSTEAVRPRWHPTRPRGSRPLTWPTPAASLRIGRPTRSWTIGTFIC